MSEYFTRRPCFSSLPAAPSFLQADQDRESGKKRRRATDDSSDRAEGSSSRRDESDEEEGEDLLGDNMLE